MDFNNNANQKPQQAQYPPSAKPTPPVQPAGIPVYTDRPLVPDKNKNSTGLAVALGVVGALLVAMAVVCALIFTGVIQIGNNASIQPKVGS